MKDFKIKNHAGLMNTADLLQGCVNRICVTDDVEELEKMFTYALSYLASIYNYTHEKSFCDNSEDSSCT